MGFGFTVWSLCFVRLCWLACFGVAFYCRMFVGDFGLSVLFAAFACLLVGCVFRRGSRLLAVLVGWLAVVAC